MKAVIKKTRNKQFRFNLIADNGEKIATSETYKRLSSAVKTLKKYFPKFTIMKLITIAVLAITLFGCTREAKQSNKETQRGRSCTRRNYRPYFNF